MIRPMARILPMSDMTRRCIQASLAGLPLQPAVRANALHAVSVLMAPTTREDARHDDARPWSRLTPTGFPLEVTFGNPADELRLSTEVGGPGLDPQKRLMLASDRLYALGHVLDPLDVALFEDLQYGQPLTWGTRVGLRAHARSLRSKLYAEVPRAGHAPALRRLTAPDRIVAELTDRGGRIVMLGLPDDGAPEFYFSINNLALEELSALYADIDPAGGAETVIQALETCVGRPLDRKIPTRQLGIRLRPMESGTWMMTVFVQTSALFDDDSQTRSALLRAGPDLGCDLSAYALFSTPSAQVADSSRHGMLALTPLPGGRVDLRIGVSPTPPRHGMAAETETGQTTDQTTDDDPGHNLTPKPNPKPNPEPNPGLTPGLGRNWGQYRTHSPQPGPGSNLPRTGLSPVVRDMLRFDGTRPHAVSSDGTRDDTPTSPAERSGC